MTTITISSLGRAGLGEPARQRAVSESCQPSPAASPPVPGRKRSRQKSSSVRQSAATANPARAGRFSATPDHPSQNDDPTAARRQQHGIASQDNAKTQLLPAAWPRLREPVSAEHKGGTDGRSAMANGGARRIQVTGSASVDRRVARVRDQAIDRARASPRGKRRR